MSLTRYRVSCATNEHTQIKNFNMCENNTALMADIRLFTWVQSCRRVLCGQ